MKQLLVALALSMAFAFVPMQAETKKDIKKETATKKKAHAKSQKEKAHPRAEKAHPVQKKQAVNHKAYTSKSAGAQRGNAANVARAPHHDEAVGTHNGKTVYEGSEHGHYYLNEHGQKEYVKDFNGAKIIGKTSDGKNIYEGPRGGHFYYSNNGTKEYIKH